MATKYYPSCGCFTRRVILGLVAPYNDSCPAICGTNIDIIGISDNFTDDGWYLQVDASNLVYMESNVIIETVPCDSGIAYYLLQADEDTSFNFWFNGSAWEGMAQVYFEWALTGLDFDYSVLLNQNTSSLVDTLVQITYDGTTFTTIDSFNGDTSAGTPTTTSNIFKYRLVNTWNDCPYYFESCPYFKGEYWDYLVSASDTDSTIGIYATIGTTATGFELNLQTSEDAGTTWITQQTNLPISDFDGLTRIDTNLPVSAAPFLTRIQLVSPLGCVHYSLEAPIF